MLLRSTLCLFTFFWTNLPWVILLLRGKNGPGFILCIWFGLKGLFYQQGVEMALDLLCLMARGVIPLARYMMPPVIIFLG